VFVPSAAGVIGCAFAEATAAFSQPTMNNHPSKCSLLAVIVVKDGAKSAIVFIFPYSDSSKFLLSIGLRYFLQNKIEVSCRKYICSITMIYAQAVFFYDNSGGARYPRIKRKFLVSILTDFMNQLLEVTGLIRPGLLAKIWRGTPDLGVEKP